MIFLAHTHALCLLWPSIFESKSCGEQVPLCEERVPGLKKGLKKAQVPSDAEVSEVSRGR